jgi:hypothetical protein
MLNWEVIDSKGKWVSYPSTPPARLRKGQQLLYHEQFDARGFDYTGPNFRMNHGTAQGEVVLKTMNIGSARQPRVVLNLDVFIFGPGPAGVVALRERILERLGMRKVSILPPAITDLWDRVVWLITGRLPEG